MTEAAFGPLDDVDGPWQQERSPQRWERFSRAVIAEHRLTVDVPGLPAYCVCGEADFMCRVRSLARKHGLENVLLGWKVLDVGTTSAENPPDQAT